VFRARNDLTDFFPQLTAQPSLGPEAMKICDERLLGTLNYNRQDQSIKAIEREKGIRRDSGAA
jgi:hypothetical protein